MKDFGNKINLTIKTTEADRERRGKLQGKIKTGNKDVLNWGGKGIPRSIHK